LARVIAFPFAFANFASFFVFTFVFAAFAFGKYTKPRLILGLVHHNCKPIGAKKLITKLSKRKICINTVSHKNWL